MTLLSFIQIVSLKDKKFSTRESFSWYQAIVVQNCSMVTKSKSEKTVVSFYKDGEWEFYAVL